MFILMTDKVICGYYKLEDAVKNQEIWNKGNEVQCSVLEIPWNDPVQTYRLAVEGKESKIFTDVLPLHRQKSGWLPNGKSWRIDIEPTNK